MEPGTEAGGVQPAARSARSSPRAPGPERVDPEWARFHTAAELIQYLADQHLVSNGELAERCGVRREQISRWLSGTHQPNLGGLTEALDKLGWRLVLSLERKPADLDDLIANPPPLTELLDLPVRVVLQAVAAASASGLDVVVGGDVAAVLQGVPVPTRHLVVHVRREHRERFLRLATRSGVSVLEAAGAQWQVRCGPVTAEVVVAPVLPASRMVTDHQDLRIPVVDLEQLLDDPRAISPSVRAAAGRLIDRAG